MHFEYLCLSNTFDFEYLCFEYLCFEYLCVAVHLSFPIAGREVWGRPTTLRESQKNIIGLSYAAQRARFNELEKITIQRSEKKL